MDRVAVFHALERAAQPLRRAGLGPLVDRARGRFERGLGTVTTEVDGLRLTGVLALHIGYLEELRDEAREGYAAALFADAAKPGSVVVDVGAHLGFFTLTAASRVGPGGRVLAVEPNPETLPLLRRNIADNGFGDRVEVIEKALTDAPGRLTFYSAPGGDTSSLHPQGHPARAVDVETAALDALVDEPARVSAIKIDVEGGEVAALEGMRATIAGAGSDLRLFVECNPEALALAGTDPDRLWATLEGLGLEPRVIDESRRTLAGREQLAAIDGYANLVCAPARR